MTPSAARAARAHDAGASVGDLGPGGATGGPAAAVPTLVLTGRGAGALAAFAALVAVALATGSLGPLPLLAALGVTFLVAPATAWARGRRALAQPPVQVYVHAVPASVPVGGTCTLRVLIAGGTDRPLPPLGLQRPEECWRLSRRLPTATVEGPTPARPGPRPRRPRRRLGRLAPGPVALLPLSPPGGVIPAGGLTRSRGWRPPAGDGQLAASASLAVPTGRRGVLHLPALPVWVHDPFGLFAVAVATTPPLAVVVHPRPAQPAGGDPPVSGSSLTGGETAGTEPWWTDAGCGDFADLRPYVPGDRLHLVDWPALARYDRLLVRRFDPEVGAGVRLVLDDRAGVHRRAGFEQLLSVMLGLVARAVDQGQTVELSTLSGLRLTVSPTPAGIAPLLPVAATLDPRRAPDTGAGPSTTSLDGQGRATVVTTATGAERLPDALRHGAQVVVAG